VYSTSCATAENLATCPPLQAGGLAASVSLDYGIFAATWIMPTGAREEVIGHCLSSTAVPTIVAAEPRGWEPARVDILAHNAERRARPRTRPAARLKDKPLSP
jgi:hypothetical protein